MSDSASITIPLTNSPMPGRRHSSSFSSMNASYHALPQSPDVAPDIDVPSAIEEAEMVGEAVDDSLADELMPSDAPVDSRIRWIHFMLGSAVLLPWNVMITAQPYFLSQLQHSPIRSTFASYLATTFTLSNFAFLAHATVTSKKVPFAQRTRWTMLCTASLTCLLILVTFFRLPEGVFAMLIITVGIALAAAGSYLQTSVTAVAALFGPTVIQSLMSGQGLVAVILSAVQFISATTSLHISEVDPTDGVAETRSARLFLGISTIFLFACGAANAWMTRLPSYRAVVPNDEPWIRRPRSLSASLSSPILGRRSAIVPDSRAMWDEILRVARRNIIYELAVTFVFTVTLSVYPAITISIVPSNREVHPLLFTSLHFLVFSGGDLFGRYLCDIPRLLIWSARRLLGLSLARVLFIPLFLACNLQRDASSPSAAPLINSDLAYMVLLFVFGLTNGYVSSMCLMSAPSLEHNPRLKGRKEDVDLAATITNFCLVGGLVIGSILSFIVRAMAIRS
ncbi:nucleoside transporter-domain-containing protein [Lactifluus subvellereus]|nr:nucleoside transporter-domain-containing protein [Lactifluus subvellereus]